jgi:hypothetical protein
MSIFDHFAQTLANHIFDFGPSGSHLTEINNHFIDLYVSIIKQMAEIDGEIAEAELHYYQNMQARLFNKNDKKLNWDIIPIHLYEKALQNSKDKWNHPFTLGEILNITDGNLPLRKDLFEIACATAGADQQFVKAERKFLDLIALEFKINSEDKQKLMHLHHLT